MASHASAAWLWDFVPHFTRPMEISLPTGDLPRPEVNFPLNGRVLDVFFPEHGLIVELDGWNVHKDRHAFENDRERDADHLEQGLRTLRITRERFDQAPDREAARLQRILDQLS